MSDKCDNCLYSRRIISENGMHSVCRLTSSKAMNCVLGKKDYYVDGIEVTLRKIREKKNDG